MSDLVEQFGDIDIYVFDQLLRGRIRKGMRILDAGCGNGRNLVYMRREGFDVWGVDEDPRAIAALGGGERFQVADIADLPFEDSCFDVILCCAVLHFAKNNDDFDALLSGMWRVLRPGGLLFCRLASNIGMEALPTGRCRLPDGSERYVVDEGRLLRIMEELGGHLADPLKTTVVQQMRCMTTWVVKKNPILSGSYT